MRQKEYRHKGYVGCRCKYCFNKRIAKTNQVNRTRVLIKRDTEREIKQIADWSKDE